MTLPFYLKTLNLRQMDKKNAILEFTNLEPTGQVTLSHLISIKWKRWDDSAKRYVEGIIDKGMWKQWIERKLTDVAPDKSATIYRVFNCHFIPAQNVTYYSREDRGQKTGRVTEAEVSIKSKDFSTIVGAMAERAAINGVNTISLENFTFSYEIEDARVGTKTYKKLKKATPVDIVGGATFECRHQEAPAELIDF